MKLKGDKNTYWMQTSVLCGYTPHVLCARMLPALPALLSLEVLVQQSALLFAEIEPMDWIFREPFHNSHLFEVFTGIYHVLKA